MRDLNCDSWFTLDSWLTLFYLTQSFITKLPTLFHRHCIEVNYLSVILFLSRFCVLWSVQELLVITVVAILAVASTCKQPIGVLC